MPLRAAKRVARRVVGWGAPVVWRRLRGPSLVVLTYHRVLPQDHPDLECEQPGMYVTPATLAMHLDVLRRHFTLVHLDDWLEARARGDALPRLACAITFDDGWRDNYEFAFPLLRAAGAPATIFLVSDFVGGSYSFWPNRLARQLTRRDRILAPGDWPAPLRPILAAAGASGAAIGWDTADVLDRAIVACKAFPDAEMHALLDRLPPLGSQGRDLLDSGEIREMAASGLIRFGSHTRHHTRLGPGTPPAVLQDEIAGSASAIADIVGRSPTLFCYPNGDHCPEALSLVREHYAGAAATDFGWNCRDLDIALIRRIGVHEDIAGSPFEYLARIESGRWRRGGSG